MCVCVYKICGQVICTYTVSVFLSINGLKKYNFNDYKNTYSDMLFNYSPYLGHFPFFGYYIIVWTCLYINLFSKFLFWDGDRFLEGQWLSPKGMNLFKALDTHTKLLFSKIMPIYHSHRRWIKVLPTLFLSIFP